MLKSIHLENFKASRDVDVRLAPLTVLAGLNASGKSTLLQALALLRQSYEQTVNPERLVLGGSLIQLGNGIDVLNERATTDCLKIDVNEDDERFSWECVSSSDRNELDFHSKPLNIPKFISSPLFQFLQADRIVPRTLYPQAPRSARDAGFLGVRGEYTADFLARNYDRIVTEGRCVQEDSNISANILKKVSPTGKLSDQVAGWMQHLSPGVSLKADHITGTDEVQLRFAYSGITRDLKSSYYRPTNVGFGVTYCLPIVVACLAAPKGTLLLLENPEAHLHPRGQAALGTLLAQCVFDDVQIIVETHSDHLLNGIRVAVKQNILSAEKTAFHFFSRDLGTGDVFVESPILFENGRLSNWPNGFFDQWDKSLDILIGG